MISQETIIEGLRHTAHAFVEPGCKPPRRSPGLCVVVRTDTAFRLPLAAIVLDAVRRHADVDGAQCDSIELALHEAVANAVMHGNLEIDNNGRDGVAHYTGFCCDIDNRLNDPRVAGRSVTINAWWTNHRLWFAVGDEGSGFTGHADAPALEQLHGRGMLLMRELAQSVRWNQRRRRMILSFSIGADVPA